MKKTISKVLILFMLLSLFTPHSIALASDTSVVKNVSRIGSTVYVSGVGKNVNVFLLNPQKTIEDLNNISTAEQFEAVVNYFNLMNVGENNNFNVSAVIDNPVEENKYLLYVKAGEYEFSKEILFSNPNEIYVSQSAPDGGDGSEEQPFNTIEKAQEYVKSLDKTTDIDVIIKGGEYKISSELTFGSEDSGTETARVTYRAEDGEEVIFNGAVKIDISKIKKVDDTSVLQKVGNEAAAHLVEVDLADCGIPDNIIRYASEHVGGYFARVTGVFFNGKRQTLAKWPNYGFTSLKDISGAKDYTVSIEGADEKIKNWTDAPKMFLEGYMAHNWHKEWIKVNSVSSVDNALTLANKGMYGNDMTGNGGRIAVVNLLEEIDIPGEWYIDENTKKMYYYPVKDITESDCLEIAALSENFIKLDGAKYIGFEGLKFKYSANQPDIDEPADREANVYNKSSAISIVNSKNINIDNCQFDEIGMDGINIDNSTDILINNSIFNSTGYSGIRVYNCGDNNTLDSCRVTISNCYISSASRDSGLNSQAGVAIKDSIGVNIHNNVFRDMKNTAIHYSGNTDSTSVGHSIKNNEFYNCVNEASDAGAIYAGRSWAQYGTVIEGNYFHDIGAGLTDYETSAVFWDDGHSGNSFIKNIVDMNGQANTAGVKIGGGRDNVVKYNVFVNSTSGVLGEYRTIDPSGSDFQSQGLFTSFIAAAKDGVTSATELSDESKWLDSYKNTYPQIKSNFNDVYTNKQYKRTNTILENVLYQTDNNINDSMSADSLGNISKNEKYTTSDIFVNAENGDYRVKNDYNKSGNLPGENESLNSIGIQTNMLIPNEYKNFELVYPYDKSVVCHNDITLKWNKSDFADKYIYEVSENADFSTTAVKGEAYDNVVTITLPKAEKRYYWRVTAVNTSKEFSESAVCDEIYTFKTSEFVVDAISYNSETKTVSFNLFNTTGSPASVIVVAAIKEINGDKDNYSLKYIDNKEIILDNNSSKTDSLKVDSVLTNDIIELYVFDSFQNLRPITWKKTWIQK